MDAIKTGALIAQARKEKGLTQRELAEKVYVSVQAVSKWELGKNFPDLSLMEPLSDILDLTVSELLAGERGEAPKDELVRDTLRLGEEQLRPKIKRWRGLFIAAAIVLAAVVTGVGIYCYPKWKAAGRLQEGMTSACFSFELEVALDRQAMEAGQVEVLEKLARLTGFEEEAMFRFTVRGSVREDKIHGMFYPMGSEDPLIELYLSSDRDVINETLPYNTIRKNLVSRYGLLDYVMPAEKEAVYMTLKQAEQIFGLDLSGLRDFVLPVPEELSRTKCFLLLWAMSKDAGEEGGAYRISAEGASLQLELPEEGSATVRFRAQELQRIVSAWRELFARLKIELPQELGLLEGISGKLVLGEGEEIKLPDKLMDQKAADRLEGIRDVIKGIREIFAP